MNTGLKNYNIFSLLGAVLLGLAVPGMPQAGWSRAIAQPNFCPDPGPIPAVADTRQLTLPQFGLNLGIPANFRAILRNDGTVEIVNPGTYEVLHCVANGGRALGRGYLSTTVRSLDNPDTINLRQFVEQNTRLRGAISPYVWQGKEGYLVRSQTDRSAQFWVNSTTANEVVIVTAGCDCDGMLNRLVTLLERSRPME